MPLTPDDLAQFIAVCAPTARLLRDQGDTPTVPAAAAALGVAPDQIIKTLLFLVGAGDSAQLVVVISHGERRIDKARLAAHFTTGKQNVRLAPAEVVLAHTGYAVGGVPPFGHTERHPVLLDAAVPHAAERYGGQLYGGGGDDHTMLQLTLSDLVRICTPVVVALSTQ